MRSAERGVSYLGQLLELDDLLLEVLILRQAAVHRSLQLGHGRFPPNLVLQRLLQPGSQILPADLELFDLRKAWWWSSGEN